MTYYSKIRQLGSLLLKMETRSKNGSGKKLLLINLSYLIPGLFLPWILVKQNADPTGFQFSFLTFLFYSLILAFTVISELDNLVISRSEAEILSAMPIDDRLIVRAKMYMLQRYITFLSLPLLLPGSIFFYSIMRSVPRAIMFIAAGSMMCFLTVNILVMLYAMAVRTFRTRSIGTYTLLFQLLMILLMIVGYQFVSFGITGIAGSTVNSYMSILQSKGVVNFLPPAWFAFLTTRNQYVFEWALILKIVLPIAICLLSFLSLSMYLHENYGSIRERFLNSRIIEPVHSAKRRFFLSVWISDFIENIYLRGGTERSSYGLIRTLYSRDKTVRLAVLPMIIIPIGLALFALFTNQLPQPMAKSYFEMKPVFHISLLLAVLVVLNTAIIGVKVTNFSGASWIYDSYPMSTFRSFRNGFRKFFVINLLIPVCTGLGIIFIIKIPLDQALLHTLFIFASANLYNSIYNTLSKTLPFTKENTVINSIQRMSSIIYPFLFGIMIILLQLFVYRNLLTASIAILGLYSVTFWINYFAFVRHPK
jgi:hypothetical protein